MNLKAIKKIIKNVPKADFGLISLTLVLMIFGVVMVFSASYYWSMDQYGKPYDYLIKDVAWAGVSIAAMVVFSFIDYKFWKKWYKLALIVSILLLIAVFVPGIGKTVKGATRWINLGITTIMPGELAKPAAILFTAGFLSKTKVPRKLFEKGMIPFDVNSLKHSVIPLIAVAGIYVLLIMKQPNMSTAMTIGFIIIAMMFVAGVKVKYFGGILALAGVAGAGLIVVGGGYRLQRFLSFLDPFKDPLGDGFQVVQSLLALGSGGITGKGIGDSVQKTLYLPEPQNDFILAIIGEELGFVGILAMVAIFVGLIWRGFKISMKAPDKFGLLLGSGVMMMIGIQLMLNIAIVTSSMPPTGVALPFVSYGGNSMVIFGVAMGVVLNISRQVRKKEMQEDVSKIKRKKVYFN